MKALALLTTTLLPILSLLTPPAAAQAGVCLPRTIVYGAPRGWLLYFNNATLADPSILDDKLTVTDETVNYLNGPTSGIPAHGPYATSKQDFLAKVAKGQQFPYRNYVGDITYNLDILEADEFECNAVVAGFQATSTAVKVKGSNAKPGAPVSWRGLIYFSLSNTNGVYRIVSVTTSQDWLWYLDSAGVSTKPKYA